MKSLLVSHYSSRRHVLVGLGLSLLVMSGCASLSTRDPLKVSVAGVESLAGEGLELRFKVKLRVQNPNDTPIEFDGVALDLEVNGRDLASGVSDQKGTVPRYGESVLTIPLNVSAYSAIRQAINFGSTDFQKEVPYTVRGKLAGGLFGTVRFSDSGKINLGAKP